MTGEVPEGVSYDLQANTLTLKDYKVTSEEIVLRSSGMGDDFRVCLEGDNVFTMDTGKNSTVTAVSVDSAVIGGTGSLTIDMSETAGGDGIMYNESMTIEDCELNITGDFAFTPSFYGITKNPNYEAGNLTVENAEVNIRSAIAGNAKYEGTNFGIDAQNGDMTVKDSDISVEMTNGEIYGIGVGLLHEGGGKLSVVNSTITCMTESSYPDEDFPYSMYFYEMENPGQNYYYAGDKAPLRQMDFDEAFGTEWFMDDRYRGAYDCLIISAEPVKDYCDHQWDKGTVTVEPACEDQGEITYTCTVCGETKKEAADPLGHDWGEWEQIKNPTCTEKGVQMRTCERCGKTENADIDALGHDYVEKVIKEATCTEDGEREVTCTRCDYSRKEVIAKTGHSYGEWVVEKEATFHEDGLKTSTCEKCGDVRSERIPKLSESHKEHDFSGKEEVIEPATCTKTGSMKVYCKEPECGEYIVKEIPMTEHTPGEWTVVTPATCTEAGVESAKCSVCGETTVRGINALGHDFAEWEVKVAATCTEDGEEVSVCTRCGETSSRIIEAAGHSYGEWIVTKEPTATEGGQRKAVCSVCGDVIVENVPAISDVQPVPPAGGSDGKDSAQTGGNGNGSNVPRTGDAAPLAACAAVVVTAAAGAVIAFRKRTGSG